MKTIDMCKPENYVSPEMEIIDITAQSLILDSNETIECNPDTDIPVPGGN